MSGAWGKPLVQRETTAEEAQAAAAAKAKAQADAAARALMASATRLKNAIEASFETRGGGVSAKYGSDEQYSVKGTWSKAEAGQAFQLWKADYGAAQVTSLGIHKLGPTQKFTGDRDGAWQFNFIRNISATDKGRFNVHVNWNGKD